MRISSAPQSAARSTSADDPLQPSLSVIVPVYNGGDEIVDNVNAIRRAVVDGLEGADFEMIVVSDGSIDDTAERLLAARSDTDIRVIHYDRNLGKGYAVRAGALASHGAWVALVDADLDLDPGSLPSYLKIARSERLDFAIGSKRHPDSVVQYPRSRRIASWCYQQLNRVLFRLDARDTQVGLKVFSRRVVEDVMPLLLVKRFAFDLELLAVARSLGYGRMRELPVQLDYRFTGSGVRSKAVLLALWDTAAIFYRLRILRTYARKTRFLVPAGYVPPEELPLVGFIGDPGSARRLDYQRLELDNENADLVALLADGARPAGNWISAAVPFLTKSEVAAVVVPTFAPLRADLRTRVAAAVLESRLGVGSRRAGYFPGNVRIVEDHPADSVVIRGADYSAALGASIDREEWVAWLASRGRATVYTPDTSVSAPPPPVIGPHMVGTLRHARARGRVARRTRGRSLSRATALSLAPGAAALLGCVLVFAAGDLHSVGLALLLGYAAVLAASGVHAAVRFHSLLVGILQPLAVVASQFAYAYGFVRGLMSA
jgi:glycosyltransferase involved in cell wall biosynthesis